MLCENVATCCNNRCILVNIKEAVPLRGKESDSERKRKIKLKIKENYKWIKVKAFTIIATQKNEWRNEKQLVYTREKPCMH